MRQYPHGIDPYVLDRSGVCRSTLHTGNSGGRHRNRRRCFLGNQPVRIADNHQTPQTAQRTGPKGRPSLHVHPTDGGPPLQQLPAEQDAVDMDSAHGALAGRAHRPPGAAKPRPRWLQTICSATNTTRIRGIGPGDAIPVTATPSAEPPQRFQHPSPKRILMRLWRFRDGYAGRGAISAARSRFSRASSFSNYAVPQRPAQTLPPRPRSARLSQRPSRGPNDTDDPEPR